MAIEKYTLLWDSKEVKGPLLPSPEGRDFGMEIKK